MVKGRMARVAMAILPLSAVLLSACATDLRLYSATLDEQGKKAQETWKDVNMTGVVAAERNRTATLVNTEATHLAGQPLVSRDAKLYSLAVNLPTPGASVNVKAGPAAQFKIVAGDGTFYANLKAARVNEAAAKDAHDAAAAEFARQGVEIPPCGDLKSGKGTKSLADLPDPNSIIKGALTLAATACTPSDSSDLDAVHNLLFTCANLTGVELAKCTASKSRLQAELEALATLQATQETTRSAHVHERNEVRVASKNVDRLSKSPEGSEPEPIAEKASAPAATASAPADAASAAQSGPTRTKLMAALERLKKAVASVKDLGDKYSLKFVSEQRLSAIDDSLSSILSPKAAGAAGETNKDRAGRALQRLADTADAWNAARGSANDILQRPLLAQYEVERLQVQALSRSIDTDQIEIDLQRTRAQLTEMQAFHLTQAVDKLNGISLGKGGMETLMYGDKNATPPVLPAKPDVRESVMEGVAHYGYAIGYLQGQYLATKLRQQALVTTRQLDLAENSLNQWDTLITTNLGLLAAWAAGGVKEETIARGVNALLLLWIGYGTNHP